MKHVECHILAYNEEEILPYTLRHYKTFCQRIVVYDAFSTDATRDIAKSFGVIVKDWETDGVNDELARRLKEQAVKTSIADWCIVADADEFVYFPGGVIETLAAYDAAGLAIIKTSGYDMFGDVFPTGPGQIYEYIKAGLAARSWPYHYYCKPILLAPARISLLTFTPGAHEGWAELRDGTFWNNVQESTEPPTYMLHYHHIGGLERVVSRDVGKKLRLSRVNLENKWGWHPRDPYQHALMLRNEILANLQQVIP